VTFSNILVRGIGLLLLVGCGDRAAIPATPDLSALRHDYDAPTALLDTDDANQTIQQNPTLRELAAAFRAAGYAADGVQPAGESAKADSDEGSIDIQGGVHVTLRCPGDLDMPMFDPATNGSISLTVAIEKSRVKRSIGGRATNCIVRGDLLSVPIRVAVDGDFAFDLGGDIGVGIPFSGRLLMRMDGTLDIAGIVFENLSARWTKDSFEYLYERPEDGQTVVMELVEGTVRLRDRERLWGCQEGEPCGLL